MSLSRNMHVALSNQVFIVRAGSFDVTLTVKMAVVFGISIRIPGS